jgi:prenyltransferase beta subunit
MRVTSLSLLAGLLLVPASPAQTPPEKQATVAYLQSLQQPDGGFLVQRPDPRSASPVAPQSSLRATSSAARALHYFGGEPKDAEAAAKFVRSCLNPEFGWFADKPGGKPDVILTAIGVMAAVELKLPRELYANQSTRYLEDRAQSFEEIRLAAAAFESLGQKPAKADAWIEQINRQQNPDGTYGQGPGQAFATGGAAAAVLRLGGQLKDPAAVVKVLKAGQRPDGGFTKSDGPSDLEATYRIMRSLHMLKEQPADPAKLREFIAKCRNEDGGYGVAPGQGSTASGTYYAGIILKWLGQ